MYASGGGHAEASAHRPLPPRLRRAVGIFPPVSRARLCIATSRGAFNIYVCISDIIRLRAIRSYVRSFIRPRARTIGHGKTQPAGRGIVTAYADALGKHGILYQLAYMRPAEQRLI